MPSLRLLTIFLLLLTGIVFPYTGIGQPDYTVPLTKPAKYKDKTLRSEKSEDKKFTISSRVYQGMVTHYNYYYNANLKIENIIAKAKLAHQDDFSELLPFYNYSPATTSADSVELDSIVYKASAGIVLHDLRNSYIDNLYMLIGRAYFHWQKYDSAYRIFQFVNYRFFPKEKDEYNIVVGSNSRTTKGELNISTKEKKGFLRKLFSKPPSRNESLIWIARTYAEDSLLDEAAALAHLLKRDRFFPKRLHRDIDEVLAYVHYRQEQWDSTSFYLKKALRNARNKNDLARWEYLLAQLYARTNQWSASNMYYARSKKHTPDPVLYIYARINEALIAENETKKTSGDAYDELLKLARKERFDGFEDILFYAASELALQKKDTAKAISLLQKSARFNTENTALRNKTYLQLADIWFHQKKYYQSSAAYDSLNLLDNSVASKLSEIEQKKAVLKDLVKQIDIVNREDSLQRIAVMGEKERYQYLKTLLKKLRKQKGIKDTDIEPTYVSASNNTNQDAGLFIQTGNTSSWYFNNNSQKSKGYTEFGARWGKRPNIDNWRRQEAVDATSNASNFMPGNPGGIDGDVDQSTAPVFGNRPQATDEQELSIESLQSDLPLTDTLLAQSNKRIIEAMFEQALIYKNKLEDYPECIAVLNEILRRFPATDKEESILFELSYAHRKNGQANLSAQYAQQLAQKYPDGKSGTLLTPKADNTDSLSAGRQYENIYALFRSGQYDAAVQEKKKADEKYGDKYWTPQLLYVESLGHVNRKNDSLALLTITQIESRFAGSEMAEKAATLKEVVSRRAAITDYLTNTDIQRDEEKKLEIPYEERRDITKASASDLRSIVPPAAQKIKKPAGISYIKRPRAGIEKIDHSAEPYRADLMTQKLKKAPLVLPAIKPLKEEITDMVYIYNPSEPYLMLMIFEKMDQVYRKEAAVSLQRYNNSVRGGEDIGTRLYETDPALNWLEIGPFPAMASSLGFYNEVAPAMNKIIPWLAADKYQLLIISEANLETLKTRRDISEYLLFIRRYIKDKF